MANSEDPDEILHKAALHQVLHFLLKQNRYEDCSYMNASSFITFLTFMLRQNVIPSWKEIFVAFKMTLNIKKHTLYVSSYIKTIPVY